MDTLIHQVQGLSLHPSNRSYYKENDEICRVRCLQKTRASESHPEYKACYNGCMKRMSMGRQL